MGKDQQEAEEQKQQSIETSQLVDKQTKEITIKKAEVMKDQERVKPAVIDAQNAEMSIKKQHMVEVKSMANPPPLIKMAQESVCILRGESSPIDWKGIGAVTMKENFIPSIVNFNTDGITDDIRKNFAKDYLSKPEYTHDRIYRANVACGPMVKWAIAQLEYAEILNRVDPRRQELRALEEAGIIKKNEASRMHELITTLEDSIDRYKEEYTGLITQAEAIKTTLKTVQDKVNRSMGLRQSPGIEKDRWGLTIDNFKLQKTTMIGDVFQSSDYRSYGGHIDQQHRNKAVATYDTQIKGKREDGKYKTRDSQKWKWVQVQARRSYGEVERPSRYLEETDIGAGNLDNEGQRHEQDEDMDDDEDVIGNNPELLEEGEGRGHEQDGDMDDYEDVEGDIPELLDDEVRGQEVQGQGEDKANHEGEGVNTHKQDHLKQDPLKQDGYELDPLDNNPELQEGEGGGREQDGDMDDNKDVEGDIPELLDDEGRGQEVQGQGEDEANHEGEGVNTHKQDHLKQDPLKLDGYELDPLDMANYEEVPEADGEGDEEPDTRTLVQKGGLQRDEDGVAEEVPEAEEGAGGKRGRHLGQQTAEYQDTHLHLPDRDQEGGQEAGERVGAVRERTGPLGCVIIAV